MACNLNPVPRLVAAVEVAVVALDCERDSPPELALESPSAGPIIN